MGTSVDFGEELAVIAAAQAEIRSAVERTLERARDGNRLMGEALLGVAEAVGVAERADHGLLLRLLARTATLKGRRAGLAAWITHTLETSPGRARELARAARTVGADPELIEELSAGRIGPDGTRVLTRAAEAVKGTGLNHGRTLTATLERLRSDGVTAAVQQVRVLEHTLDPGLLESQLARQRARSFLRIGQAGSDGMVRLEALLDPVRGAAVWAGIEATTGSFLRERQYDDLDRLPPDVYDPEQVNAEVLYRMVGLFLSADPKDRGAHFIAPTLYYTGPQATTAPVGDEGAEPTSPKVMKETAHSQARFGPFIPPGTALTAYGALVPLSAIPQPGGSQAQVLSHDPATGELVLDGKPVDQDTHARLASQAQRTVLGFRDQHCTHPGCSRPPTWSLHAHHQSPYGCGGATTLDNLRLLCPEHHALTHQEIHQITETHTTDNSTRSSHDDDTKDDATGTGTQTNAHHDHGDDPGHGSDHSR